MKHVTLGFLTVDKKGRATLPRELRRALGLDEHTQLRIDRTEDGTYELVPAEVIPRDQLWYHSEEGRSRIERAEEDFRSGQSTRVRGAQDAQRHLDALKERSGNASRERLAGGPRRESAGRPRKAAHGRSRGRPTKS